MNAGAFVPGFVQVQLAVQSRNEEFFKIAEISRKEWIKSKEGLDWQTCAAQTIRNVNKVLQKFGPVQEENLPQYTELAKAIDTLNDKARQVHEISHRKGFFARIWDWILRKKPEPFQGVDEAKLQLFRNALLQTRKQAFIRDLQKEGFLEKGPFSDVYPRVKLLGARAFGSAFFLEPDDNSNLLSCYRFAEQGNGESYVTISHDGIYDGATRFDNCKALIKALKSSNLGIAKSLHEAESQIRHEELQLAKSKIPPNALEENFKVVSAENVPAFAIQQEGEEFYLYRGENDKNKIEINISGQFEVLGKTYENLEKLKIGLKLEEPLESASRRIRNRKALDQCVIDRAEIPKGFSRVRKEGKQAFALCKDEERYWLFTSKGEKQSSEITIAPTGELQVDKKQYQDMEALKQALALGADLHQVLHDISLQEIEINLLQKGEKANKKFAEIEKLPFYKKSISGIFAVERQAVDTYTLWKKGEKDSYTIKLQPNGQFQVGAAHYDTFDKVKEGLALGPSVQAHEKLLRDLEKQASDIRKVHIDHFESYCQKNTSAQRAMTELEARKKVLKESACGMSRWVSKKGKNVLYIIEKEGERQVIKTYAFTIAETNGLVKIGNQPFIAFVKGHKLQGPDALKKVERDYEELNQQILDKKNELERQYKSRQMRINTANKELEQAISFLGEHADGAYLFWKEPGQELLHFSSVKKGQILHQTIDFEDKPGFYTLKSENTPEKLQTEKIGDLFTGLYQDWDKKIKLIEETRNQLFKYNEEGSLQDFEALNQFFEKATLKGCARPDVGGFIIYPDLHTNSKAHLNVIEETGLKSYVIDLASSPGEYLVEANEKLAKDEKLTWKKYKEIPKISADETSDFMKAQGFAPDYQLRSPMKRLKTIQSQHKANARRVLSDSNFTSSVGSSSYESAQYLNDLLLPYKDSFQGAWLVRASSEQDEKVVKIEPEKLEARTWYQRVGGWIADRIKVLRAGPEKFTISILRKTNEGMICENIPVGVLFTGKPGFTYNGKEYPGKKLTEIVDIIRQDLKVEAETWASLSTLSLFGEILKEEIRSTIMNNTAFNTSEMTRDQVEDELQEIAGVMNKPIYMFAPMPAQQVIPKLPQATMQKPRLGTYLFSFVDASGFTKTYCLDVVCDVKLDSNGVPSITGRHWNLLSLEKGAIVGEYKSLDELRDSLQLIAENSWQIQKGLFHSKIKSSVLSPFEDISQNILSTETEVVVSFVKEMTQKNSLLHIQPYNRNAQKLACGFFMEASPERFQLNEVQTTAVKESKIWEKFSRLPLFEQYQVVQVAYEENALPQGLRSEPVKPKKKKEGREIEPEAGEHAKANLAVKEKLLNAFIKNMSTAGPRKHVEGQQLQQYLATQNAEFARMVRQKLNTPSK